MPKGGEIVGSLRRELESLNKMIAEHPYLSDAERGALPREKIERFVVNQLYIIPHDLRSLGHMLSRASEPDEIRFFKAAVDGDYAAMQELLKLAGELGIGLESATRADPEAVAYTHYLAWLASYATPGQAAVALVVNLPVWGAAVGRLGRALKERYGIKETGLFELFAQDYSSFEEMAYPIIERYENLEAYRLVARMIQHYEKMFWDAIYR
uniref:TenA family transcriptional regulator n=1 Tax=Fervidicoccus fontis TaxID=683846 RepID=A0A7J3ZL41_9CREN